MLWIALGLLLAVALILGALYGLVLRPLSRGQFHRLEVDPAPKPRRSQPETRHPNMSDDPNEKTS